MYLPLALHRRHVWCYVCSSVQHLFTWQMFSVHLVQQCKFPHVTTINTTLCVKWHRFTRICHISKQFTTHRPTSQFLWKYSILRVCFCSEHTWHHHCIPFKGEYCECFTSSWLSWDANGLGLPCEMPLAVMFSSCKWLINLWTSPGK